MNLLYLILLLIFGAISDDGSNTSSELEDNMAKQFLDNSTETTENCNQGDAKYYVECTFANLTTNITNLSNLTQPVQNDTITSQNGEQEPTCNVTKCVQDEIIAMIIKSFNSDLEMKNMCTELFASHNTVEKIYNSSESVYKDVICLPFDGATKIHGLGDFNMTVIKLNITDLGFVQISAPKLSDDDMPIIVFIPTEPCSTVPEEQLKVGVVTYPAVQMFIDDSESEVIHIETVGHEIKNLSIQLVINFTLNCGEITENLALSWKYYDETEDDRNEMVSLANLKNSSNTEKCPYDHMNLFAVLLGNVSQIKNLQQKIWSRINYIDNRPESVFYYNSTELEFVDGLNSSICNWGESLCYVECSSVNLTTNITCVNNVMKLVQSDIITGQNNTWLVFNMGEKIATCNVTKCESDEMTALIPNIDFIRLTKLQKMCNKSFASDIYIRAEKEFIDRQLNSEFDGPNKTYEYENFTMTVFNIDMMNTMDDGHVKISAPKLSGDDPPIDVFFPVDQFLNVSEGKLKVGVVTYRSAQHFMNNSNTVLKSKVIRVEIVGYEHKNLTEELVIRFPVNSSEIISGNYKLSCQFYNETEHMWDDMGSLTNLENFNSSNTVNCSYNHMTPFAVLLVFDNQKNLSCNSYIDNKNKNFFFYNSTELTIEESVSTLHCSWGTQCYLQCTSFNLTINMMGVNNISMVQNVLITNQTKMLVLKISEQETTCNVTMCVTNEIIALINKLSNSNDLQDLQRPTQIITMCNESFASDSEVKKAYISSEKKYIDALIGLPFNGTNKSYDHDNFNVIVVNMAIMKNTTDLGHVHIPAPKVSDYDLPLDVFIPIEPFLNVSEEKGKVAIVTYLSAEQFKSKNNTFQEIKTTVIAIETVGNGLKNLPNRLVINFTVNSSYIIPENHTLACQFFDITADNWSDTGSFTNLDNFNSSNIVTCSYDHMTPFAVLLVNMNVIQIDSQQWEILSYITYIGCSLSSFFSVVTIFIYTFMKRSDRDSSIHIHVSLSVALFLLNTSFLFIDWGATWSQDSLCVLIAVIIQYSLLSCFSWMAIEAAHLYLLLIKVFNTQIKHYMVKLSLFGWGVPAILVGGSLCAFGSYPFYGPTQIQLSNTNKRVQFCWITDHRFLYGMNIPYVSLTLLFNTCVLVAVTHQIFKLRCLNVRGSKLPSCKDVCTVLGLTMLLGMTWGLAFFTLGYTNYPILYLFCICNTLQGLLLFLWFYGTLSKTRSLMAQTSTLPTSTSLNTHESINIH